MKVKNTLKICCAAALLAAGAAVAQEYDNLALNDSDVYILTPVVESEVIAFDDGTEAYVSRDFLALNDTETYIVTPVTPTFRDDPIVLGNSDVPRRYWGASWRDDPMSSGLD